MTRVISPPFGFKKPTKSCMDVLFLRAMPLGSHYAATAYS